MGQVTLHYEPTARQRAFHASKAFEVLYGGAAGGGKSYACVWDALLRCLRHPGTEAFLFRRTYQELEKNLVAIAQRVIPPQLGTYSASHYAFRLVNGSTMRFCHCNNEDADKLRYQGAEIHWLYIDELTHFRRDTYEYLRTRVRADRRLGIRPLVRCTANPGGPGHAWVRERFVDPAPPGTIIREPVASAILGRTQVRTRQFIQATVRDNPYIDDDYVFELESKPRALRDALLLGRWDAFEGQAFPEWTDDPAHYADGRYTHVIAPFDPPAHWPRWISFDYGYSRPFSCGVWAVGERGEVYRYKEVYGCDGAPNEGVRLAPGDIARRIERSLEPERRAGIAVFGVADPSIWDGSRGASVYDQMREAVPALFLSPGNNARLPGKAQLHERLRFDADGRPMLQVCTTCRDFIRTVPALAYDPAAVEDIDTRAEDHAYDETRYFLMSRPLPPRTPPQRRTKRFDPLG